MLPDNLLTKFERSAAPEISACRGISLHPTEVRFLFEKLWSEFDWNLISDALAKLH